MLLDAGSLQQGLLIRIFFIGGLGSGPAVLLNVDTDPAVFSLRIRIQLNKLWCDLLTCRTEKTKDCSKVKIKNMQLV